MAYARIDLPLAAEATPSERALFIQKTYLHLGGAILAFVALCAVIVQSPLAQTLTLWMTDGMNWLLVLGAFMVVGWLADRWAQSGQSVQMQYIGLGLYVVAQAVLFTPLLFIASWYAGPELIPTAGLLTLVLFGGLTATAVISGKDFSFLRRALGIAGFAAMGLIVAGILFGFTLGLFFSGVMVVFASGYVLYYTSQVLRHYPIGSHVAAALALFSAVALMFWYILRILLSLSRSD